MKEGDGSVFPLGTGKCSRVRRFTIGKVFLDTNILLYAQDSSSSKQAVAASLILKIQHERNGVVSTQVLQEFYANLTRKFKLAPIDAAEFVRDLRPLELVVVTEQIIDQAMSLHAAGHISFWDSLIVSAAAHAKCQTLLTEDLSHGETRLGVRTVNPFAS